MYKFPHWLAHRLGVLNKPMSYIYCSRCKTRNDGQGVFLCFQCGPYLLIPHSKGRDRVRWETIKDGGICCDSGHYTYLKNGSLVTVDSEAEDATYE